MTTFITALAILIGLLIGGAIALRAWMSAGDKARAEIDALPDVPGHLKPAILDCMDQAEDADKATWPYDLTAPIVMLVALAFTKRDADRLPACSASGTTTSASTATDTAGKTLRASGITAATA